MQERSSDYPAWAFRIWHGMTLKAWLGFLARNSFAISPRRALMLLDVTACAVMNSLVGMLQNLIYGRRVARTTISVPPVFIVGHWRTGTTGLHEMLALDRNFVAPTTYECLVPSHALLTGPISILSRFRAPRLRPMDGMAVGWERPQEDEFALMNLGAGSFLETFGFPNHRPVRAEYIDLAELSEVDRQKWIAARMRFLKQVQCRAEREAQRAGQGARVSRRLLLKSPQDTARVALLKSLFPGACFIHLVRDPEEIFASTTRLWTAFAATQALHAPDWKARPEGTPSIEEFVLSTFQRLYRNFVAEKRAIPAQQWLDVRYEDLRHDPVGTVAQIYAHFGWDGFAELQPQLRQYMRDSADRRIRTYKLPPEIRALVAERWGEYAARYGYNSGVDTEIRLRKVAGA